MRGRSAGGWCVMGDGGWGEIKKKQYQRRVAARGRRASKDLGCDANKRRGRRILFQAVRWTRRQGGCCATLQIPANPRGFLLLRLVAFAAQNGTARTRCDDTGVVSAQ